MTSMFRTFLVLAALLVPALLVGLGDRPVYKIQEVRIAETAREMVASGDWLVPRYNGELRLQKPPLPYWLTGASYWIGGVDEVGTRLPAVLFGLLSAALMLIWVRREAGVKIAANAALVLVASYIGLRYFRSGEADSVLLFFVSAACMLGYGLLYGARDGGRRLLFGLALGLGFLSKGPAALAIPLLTLLVVAVIDRRAGRGRVSFADFFSLAGVVAMLVVAAGWYLWIGWKMPEIMQTFVGKQVDETFVSGSHAKPLWWYLAHWFEFFAPWGLLLLPAGWMAWKQRRQPMPALLRFAWIWLGVVFVLLTATVNKQMQYALLLAPPQAIVLGYYLARAEGGFARANRVLFGIFAIAAVAGFGFALYKSADSARALLWLALPLLPLIVQRILREANVSTPVLLVAGVTAMAYLYSEANLSKEPHKVAAQTVMQEAAIRTTHSPLYQLRTPLNDGALSFYAGRVVPPADATELTQALENQPEVWVVGEERPVLPAASVEQVLSADELKLFRVQRKP
ncbi:MAG: glycosyltransferase family 39 protein [Propionivibrio sp.]